MAKKQFVSIDPSSGDNNSEYSEVSISDLSDVKDSVTPSNGYALVYSSSEGLYVPTAISSNSSGFVDAQQLLSGDNYVVEDKEEIRRANIYVAYNSSIEVDYGGSVYITDGLPKSVGLSSIVQDTNPQLGGNLDINGNEIVSTSNQDITISPDGTGSLVVNSDIVMGSNSITDAKISEWDTSYSWGDHASEGYLKNVVEDTTPQLGGDLVCDDGTASGSTSTIAAKSLLRTSSITFRTLSGAAYQSGGQITQTNFARKIFLNPSFGNAHSSNSVIIGSIGSADTAVDNGKGTGISKVEAPSSTSLLFGANSFTNTSYIQVNSGEDALDSQSNSREGVELRLRESSTGIASVSIKSINLNASTGISATRSPKLKFYNPDDMYVSIQAPDDGNLSSNVGFILPNTVGSSNQVLKTDGATPIATLSWTDQSSGSMSTLADDTSPQLGGNLDLNSNNIVGSGSITISSGDISATTGNISATTGNISVTTGDIYTSSGSLSGGTLYISNGTYEEYGSKTSITADSTVTFDCSANHLFLVSNIGGNFTANLTNLGFKSGSPAVTSVTIILKQGATARICSAIQISGSSKTISWQGGLTPSGTSNGMDVMSFSIIYDGSSTYDVLGQLVDFG